MHVGLLIYIRPSLDPVVLLCLTRLDRCAPSLRASILPFSFFARLYGLDKHPVLLMHRFHLRFAPAFQSLMQTSQIPKDLEFLNRLRATTRMSTGALGALDDPLVFQTNVFKSGSVPVDSTWHL